MAYPFRTLIVTAGLAWCMISDGFVQRSYAASGILTGRLSHGELQIWKSIRKIVLAKDKKGLPKHPRLFDLWCRLEASGHEVHIELIDHGLSYSNQVGRFAIEALDPTGRKHICAIRLNLFAIRQAYTKADAMRRDGFVPLAELRDMQRYAEVLGHEMVHALGILLDHDYLKLYQELSEGVADYEQHLKSQDATPDDLEGHLNKIKHMQGVFEKPAEAAEAEIWRELRQIKVKNTYAKPECSFARRPSVH